MHEDVIIQKASRIDLLLMDVDGVLTDGKILWLPLADGTVAEAKAFDVQDGLGISLARRAGLKTGWITKRISASVTRRAEELKINYVLQGVRDKRQDLEFLLVKHGFAAEQVCFIGDDWVDIPAMIRVGFPVAVANARPEVKERSAYVTQASGGNGAIREVVELILRAKGQWDALFLPYTE